MTETTAQLIEQLAGATLDQKLSIAARLITMGDEVIPHFIKCLNNPDPVMRLVAIEALGGMGAEAATPGIIPHLIAPEPTHREAAFSALLNIGPPAIPALIENFRHDNPDLRLSAARVTGKMGQEALSALLTALQDDSETVRYNAAVALGRIGAEEAIDPLINALGDSDWKVRQCAGQALEHTGLSAVPAIIESLSRASSQVQQYLTGILIQIGPSAIPLLIEALPGNNRHIRFGVTTALVQIGLHPLLLAALEHEERAVRYLVIKIFERIGDSYAIRPLIPMLKDPDSDVRHAAALSLESLGWRFTSLEEAIPFWIARRDWEACMDAGEEAIPALRKLLHDSSMDIRNSALKTLIWHGRPVVDDLKALADDWAVGKLASLLRDAEKPVREKAALALRNILTPEHGQRVATLGPELMRALQDESSIVREHSTAALVILADRRATDALLPLLDDPVEAVQRQAGEALAHLGSVQSIPPLLDRVATVTSVEQIRRIADSIHHIGTPALDQLHDALSHTDSRVQSCAALALGLIGEAKAVPWLIDLLEEWRYIIRLTAAEALGNFREDAAQDALKQLLETEEEPQVREAVMAALQRIAAEDTPSPPGK